MVLAGALALLSGIVAGLLLARSGGWIRDLLDFFVAVSPGVSRFLFNKFLISQYAPQVNTLWVLVLIFLLTYGSMRLVIFGLKRGFAHD